MGHEATPGEGDDIEESAKALSDRLIKSAEIGERWWGHVPTSGECSEWTDVCVVIVEFAGDGGAWWGGSWGVFIGCLAAGRSSN